MAGYLLKLGFLRHTENKAHFVRILCLQAQKFKVKKFILNYASFKHCWVLEVMSILVDINEKIVLWLRSPGSCACLFQSSYF